MNDFDFLQTLSDRDWRSGISEAIKVALIRDGSFFDAIERDAARLAARDQDAMERLIRRSAALHLAHVTTGGDPFELGSSRPLDFGHWAAHKLEQMSGHRLRHGEAVAIGIAIDTTYARLTGLLAGDTCQRVLDVLTAVGFDLRIPALDGMQDTASRTGILDGLEEFREHLGGELTVMLLRDIGQAVDVHEIDRNAMMQSIELVANAQARAHSGSVVQTS